MRTDLNAVRNLLIDTPNGTQVRLEDVASVSIVPTPNVIKREGVSRRIDIQADVQGRDIAAVAQDIKEMLKTIDFPLSITQNCWVNMPNYKPHKEASWVLSSLHSLVYF